MRLLFLLIPLFFTNNAFSEDLANLRGDAFRESSICNIIKAKEILELSTKPLTDKNIPNIHTLIIDTKTARTDCYEKAEEIISDVLTGEQNLINQENAEFILKLQYEADLSFKQLLKLRKQVSQQLLDNILADIEDNFSSPTPKAIFYTESAKTKYLIKLETTLNLESERRQIFVTEQYFKPTDKQKINSILQKSHYQFTKILLMFEDWPAGEDKQQFFNKFNGNLRYSINILSSALTFKSSFDTEKYKIFRDMLQKAVRLNLKMMNKENQTIAKSSEIYSEISNFTKTIRNLLKN